MKPVHLALLGAAAYVAYTVYSEKRKLDDASSVVGAASGWLSSVFSGVSKAPATATHMADDAIRDLERRMLIDLPGGYSAGSVRELQAAAQRQSKNYVSNTPSSGQKPGAQPRTAQETYAMVSGYVAQMQAIRQRIMTGWFNFSPIPRLF